MKKLVSLIFCSVLLFANTPILQATPVAPEVQRLYAAAQQDAAVGQGQMQRVENILDWHRADKKKPEALLQQARALAVEDNDAQAAVVLTTRLKQEQMGAWERYFRGITLAATVAVVMGIAVVGSKAYADRQRALRGQLPPNYDIEDINSDGTRYNPRTDLAESQSFVPEEREMEDFTGRDRTYSDDSGAGLSHRLPGVIFDKPDSKRSS